MITTSFEISKKQRMLAIKRRVSAALKQADQEPKLIKTLVLGRSTDG